jgi:1-deoxy-D-xylulose-5-phosphate reductoisomerase
VRADSTSTSRLQRITVLGSTGSIGVNTLEVLALHPDRFEVFALTAHQQIDKLISQCVRFAPKFAVVPGDAAAHTLKAALLAAKCPTEILVGEAGLCCAASDAAVDTVVAAIVGGAGLKPTMAAVLAGKRILLANKEALVMAGSLFMQAAAHCKAQVLPVDSEHNAIFQCLPVGCKSLLDAGVKRILLTGSGGPFRQMPIEQLPFVTAEQACKHPNWAMGRKISVDSATMMNKGLEFIEACWLFNARPREIDLLLHPQSIIHSMVEYLDGSVLAQMGQPDMRTPIAHCLAWPQRLASGVTGLDFLALGALEFAAPCERRYPSLALAKAAMSDGGLAPAALNAANEIAVEAFLQGQINFVQISELVDEVMQSWQNTEPSALDEVYAADQSARAGALRHLSQMRC